jgi:RimJ/RimL family protein N-acetyltransferase
MDLFTPAVLEGKTVRLEPLQSRHFDDLCAVGMDEDLWQISLTPMRTRQELLAYLNEALQEAENRFSVSFAIVHRQSGKAIGSSRFANISPQHRRLEIGWTWIAKEWQRTAVNTETKYLMLRHAFEQLSFYRVELKTDALNERSRKAILRIGAKEEGTLRGHMVTSGGRIRDTVYYSILAPEWPAVKAGLEQKIRAA